VVAWASGAWWQKAETSTKFICRHALWRENCSWMKSHDYAGHFPPLLVPLRKLPTLELHHWVAKFAHWSCFFISSSHSKKYYCFHTDMNNLNSLLPLADAKEMCLYSIYIQILQTKITYSSFNFTCDVYTT